MVQFSTATDSTGVIIKLPDPALAIVMAPNGMTLYVVGYEGGVTSINTATSKITATIAAGSFPTNIGITPTEEPSTSQMCTLGR